MKSDSTSAKSPGTARWLVACGLLAALCDRLEDAVVMVSPQRRVVWLNAAARKLFAVAAHLEPAYAGHPHPPLPITELLTSRTLILPLYHDLAPSEQDHVVDVLRTALLAVRA